MRTALSLEKSLGVHDARESRRSAPATTNQTHARVSSAIMPTLLNPHIASLIAGFFIPGSGQSTSEGFVVKCRPRT